jgi:hypothetical protein
MTGPGDEEDPVFQIPIPPPVSGYPLREPGPVRPSRIAVMALRTFFWLGALSIAATVLFFGLVALWLHAWAEGGKERDKWQLARARESAAKAEQTLLAAAQDGTLSDAEIVAVLRDPWAVSRSATDVRVLDGLDWGPACSVYLVSLPLGPQTWVKRIEISVCDLDFIALHRPPTRTPSPR